MFDTDHSPAPGAADAGSGAERLLTLYWDLFAEEQISLERFCRRVAAGELGEFSPADLRAFLEIVEANILSNIETMIAANPHLEPLRDERAAETQEMIADLIARYATPSSGSFGRP